VFIILHYCCTIVCAKQFCPTFMKVAKKSTIKTIAAHVGVSVTTVSRVMTGQATDYRISKGTEIAIRGAAEKLDYAPNQLARGLRNRQTYTIGLVIPDIANPFFSSIAKVVEMEARKAGYSIILCDSQESTNIEIDALRLLQTRNVDGLIISSVGQDGKHLERLAQQGIPMVVVDRSFPNLKCPSVSSDNYQGALDAVSYLIENGHRMIACIQGLRHTSPNEDRVRGYRDAHQRHHLAVNESLIVGDSFGENNGYIETKILLKRANRPTAIFAVSNLISLGVLRAVAEEGLKIRDDVSVISFDDQPYSNYLATPMTTVAQQNYEIGKIACKLLFEQIRFKKPPDAKSFVVPTKLIVRQSVKKIGPISFDESLRN